MSRKFAIVIKNCDIKNSEKHNKREIKLSYQFDEYKNQNESYYFSDNKLEKIQQNIKQKYEEKYKQKMQAKSTPIREAVIVIKKETKMEDLKLLANEYEKKLKIQTLQIYIHKDEGHINSDNKFECNYHAHFVLNFTDENGKNLRLKPADYSELQNIGANILKMERGKNDSKAKHLSHKEYRNKITKEQELELNNFDELINEKKQEYNTLKNKYENLILEHNKNNEIFKQLMFKKRNVEILLSEYEKMELEKRARNRGMRM